MRAALLVVLLAVLASVLLAGCASPQLDAVTVRWVRVEDPLAECRKVYPAAPLWGVRGCAVMRGAECTIYARDVAGPEDRERLATLGHELKHCFDGRWHK